MQEPRTKLFLSRSLSTIALVLSLLSSSSGYQVAHGRSRISQSTIVVIVLERDRATISTDSLAYNPQGKSHLGEKAVVLGNRILFSVAGLSEADIQLSDGSSVKIDPDTLAREVFDEAIGRNPRVGVEQVALVFRDRQQAVLGQLVVKAWRSIKPHIKEDGGLLDAVFVGLDADRRVRMTHMHYYVQVTGNQALLTVRDTQTVQVNGSRPLVYLLGHFELLAEIRNSGGKSRPELRDRPGIRALLDEIAPDPILAAEDLVRIVLENAKPEWHVSPPVHTYQVTSLGVQKVK